MTVRRLVPVVVAAVLFSPQWNAYCATPAAVEPSVGQLTEGNTEFAIALYKQVARQDGNVAISPLNISLAIGMLYAGAAGKTATEIAAAARFKLPEEKLHSEFAALVDDMEARIGKWGAMLSFADGIWLDRHCEPSPRYTAVLSEFYHAAAETVDFRGAPENASSRINDFVSRQTRGKIQSVVDPEMFTAADRLVLASTVYFLAPWDDEFSVASTREEPFHLADSGTVSARMMHRAGAIRYYGDDSVQVVQLPYQGIGLSMLVVLPTPNRNLTDLEALLTPEILWGWVNGLAGRGVQLALPRFEVARHIDLIPLLQSMGMQRVFDEYSAELPGLCGERVFVDYAEHDVVLGVTEKGTEAAAATVFKATIGVEEEVEPVISFRADRPFMYMIRDMRSGTILFMGRVMDPTK